VPENNAKAIIKAAKIGDTSAINALIDQDPALTDARDTDGSTPLHCAAWKGHVDAVRALLDAGSDIAAQNQNDHWGTTPLHAAAHANQREIAALLIAAGADVNARDMEGRTPLAHTEFHKAKAAAKILAEHGGEMMSSE
jgi:cytohesin